MDELDPRFKIRAPLRCDGIGRLDCAEDLESGMRMAVRWLPLEANGSAAVEACEQLPEHPTLPRIRQTGQMGASAYVAMEFPDGNLLATHLGESFTAATLIGITAQIADALATIHSQDVFHGEMSADSVLLVKSPSEKAFLWDMPLVIANRLTDRRGEERLMTQLVKTAPYLSPERACGGECSGEADVYALGAIICIAGGAPLPSAGTTLAVVHAVVTGTWLPKVPKAIPEPLRAMLERMIARKANERPSAREVADLFMPPVAARATTLPEMQAVVVPPPVLRPVDPMMARPTAPSMPIIDKQEAVSMPQSALDTAVVDPLEASIPEISDEDVVKAGAEVELTDNLSVSRELHNSGAVLLTPAEAAMLSPRSRLPMIVGAVLVVLITVLTALAIDLARKAPGVVRQSLSPVSANAQQVTREGSALTPRNVAAAPADSDDDLLSPLTPRAKSSPPQKARKQRAAHIAAEAAFQETSPQPASPNKDFGFLEADQELKRPSF